MNPKDSTMLCFIAAVSPAPYCIENSIPLPMHSPSTTEVRNTITAYDAPTAASASGPRNRPTISVSATLYTCWSRLPAIIGAANRSRLRVTGPFVREVCMLHRPSVWNAAGRMAHAAPVLLMVPDTPRIVNPGARREGREDRPFLPETTRWESPEPGKTPSAPGR